MAMAQTAPQRLHVIAAGPTASLQANRHRTGRALLVDALMALAVVGLSLALRGWAADIAGDNAFLEFLRAQWLLLLAGNGVALDPLSLPVPPLVFLAAAALGGPQVAEVWLPIALNVAILLVLTRVLLRGYPAAAKLLAAVPLLATPFFYLLLFRLDLQLFVLLLGLQVATLRAFRLQPTVARVTWAIGLNIALSLTSYAAPAALGAAVGYLLLIANYKREVQVAAWRALLWLYAPFSLAGYLVWMVAWATAGSRLKTSYFLTAAPEPFGRLTTSVTQTLGLPLLLLVGLAVILVLFLRSPDTRMRGGRSQAAAWVVLSFAATGLGWLVIQTLVETLPSEPDALTFAFVLLIPAAIGSVYGQTRNILNTNRGTTRLLLVGGLAIVMVAFSMQYLLRPIVWGDGLPSAERRAAAAREAARAFRLADPGGRVLVDPRFAATFVLEGGINPNRLLTPFDQDFSALVAAPPDDVRTIVVTDAEDDFVGGNYPRLRLLDVVPDATLLAEGRARPALVRAFRREPPAALLPDLERAIVAPYAAAEERLLAEVARRLGPDLMPTRMDGWAYGIDIGNILLYAAERGDAGLFTAVDRIVRDRLLVTEMSDGNALYTVAWRAHADRQVDASGTTESLRVVDAYVTAAERWAAPEFDRLARVIGRAYVAHEQPQQDGHRWFIRNYYNYGTKQYATNTYIVDYDPDVLARLAQRTGDPEIERAAVASAELVQQAQHASGLFYLMYQPEIQTIHPGLEFFAPNALAKTYDAAEVALGTVSSDRAIAERVLEFARTRGDVLEAEYSLTDLHGHGGDRSPALFAGITRLAVALGDLDFARQTADEHLASELEDLISAPASDSWFFNAITTLLSLRELQAAMAG